MYNIKNAQLQIIIKYGVVYDAEMYYLMTIYKNNLYSFL